MANILKAFSNKSRLKIMICLSKKDRNVTDLINNCGLSQSAVSQHLKILRDNNIIDCKDSGRENIYYLKDNNAAEVSENLFNFINKSKGEK